jgi:release factor glutamine methyltransferase
MRAADADVDGVVARLRGAGCVFAEDEAALLVEAATSRAELDALVERRVAGTPLEQVLGWAAFRGRRLQVEPGVFVPRLRTGFLVDLALRAVHPGSVVLDLCCGIGALAAAIEQESAADLEVHAADIDAAAVRCARRNVAAPERVYGGDLFAALPLLLRGRIDVIAVNAPYVPTDEIRHMPPEARDFEARVALDGGDDGLDVHRRVAAEAADWLVPGGLLVIETSAAQADRTLALFTGRGFDAHIETDDARDATAVTAWSPRAS